MNHVVTRAGAAGQGCLPPHSVSQPILGETGASFGGGQSRAQNRVPLGRVQTGRGSGLRRREGGGVPSFGDKLGLQPTSLRLPYEQEAKVSPQGGPEGTRVWAMAAEQCFSPGEPVQSRDFLMLQLAPSPV